MGEGLQSSGYPAVFFKELNPTGDSPGPDRGDFFHAERIRRCFARLPSRGATVSARRPQSSGESLPDPDLSGLAALPPPLPSPSVRPAAARASAQGAFVGPTGTADLAGRRPHPISPGAPALPAPLGRMHAPRPPTLRPQPRPQRPRGPRGRPALTFRARSARLGSSYTAGGGRARE